MEGLSSQTQLRSSTMTYGPHNKGRGTPAVYKTGTRTYSHHNRHIPEKSRLQPVESRLLFPSKLTDAQVIKLIQDQLLMRRNSAFMFQPVHIDDLG